MAIRDLQTTFADNVSIAAVAGTAVIGNVIDTGIGTATVDGINDVDDLNVVIEIGGTALITGGSAGTVQFKVTSADDTGLSTNAVDHIISASIVTGASGNAKGKILLNVSLPVDTYKRYVGIKCITGTTTTTAGTIYAFLTKGISTWKAFVAGTTDLPLA